MATRKAQPATKKSEPETRTPGWIARKEWYAASEWRCKKPDGALLDRYPETKAEAEAQRVFDAYRLETYARFLTQPQETYTLREFGDLANTEPRRLRKQLGGGGPFTREQVDAWLIEEHMATDWDLYDVACVILFSGLQISLSPAWLAWFAKWRDGQSSLVRLPIFELAAALSRGDAEAAHVAILNAARQAVYFDRDPKPEFYLKEWMTVIYHFRPELAREMWAIDARKRAEANAKKAVAA